MSGSDSSALATYCGSLDEKDTRTWRKTVSLRVYLPDTHSVRGKLRSGHGKDSNSCC